MESENENETKKTNPHISVKYGSAPQWSKWLSYFPNRHSMTFQTKHTGREDSQVADNDTVQKLSELSILWNIVEIRKSALIIVAHVHPTIKHDVLPANGQQYAAAANICNKIVHNQA